jgi:hypothetical protein
VLAMCGEPILGEKNSMYPHGYGFCQCGCEKLTQMDSAHKWIAYIDGHQPIQVTGKWQAPPTDNLQKLPHEISGCENDSKSGKVSPEDDVVIQEFNVSKLKFSPLTVVGPSRRYIYAERGLLDAYIELHGQYGELQRQMAVIKIEVTHAATLVDEFWAEGDEPKNVLAEKLKLILSHFRILK